MSTLAPPTTPTTVLVVDDEDGIRQALNRFLSRLGYRVLQAASAAEALDQQAANTIATEYENRVVQWRDEH